MADGPRRVRDLIQEVLDEQAEAITASAETIEAEVVQLRRLFQDIQERATAARAAAQRQAASPSTAGEGAEPDRQRRLRYEAVLRPGTYRLRLGELTFRVILGRARQTSRIVLDAARDLLIPDAGGWGMTVPGVELQTRSGVREPSQIDIAQQGGSAVGTVIADDAGEEPRVLVLIRGFPAGQPAPVLELAEVETEGGEIIRVEPESSPERSPNRSQDPHR